MAVGIGLVDVGVRAGPMVGVGVNVDVGFGVKVAVGDGSAVGVSVEVLVGNTRAGLAKITPPKRIDIATSAMVSPIKMYLISEDMDASIRG